MPHAVILTLPPDLLTATQKVPDFQAKLEQFARTEVALHQFRKGRYQQKNVNILTKAKRAIAGKAVSETDRVSLVEEFLKNYQAMFAKR